MNHPYLSRFTWFATVLLVGLLVGGTARSEDGGGRRRGHEHHSDHAAHAGGAAEDRDVPQWNDHAPAAHEKQGRGGDRHMRPKRRPGGEARRGGPGPAGHGRPSEAEMAQFRQDLEQRLEILREINPDIAERIERHLERRGDMHPERIRSMLRERFQRIERLIELKQEDPVAYELAITDMKLERQSQEVADQIRLADGDLEAQRERLRALIREHFDVRQRKYEQELGRLEKRIAELRGQLETRRNHRTALEQTRFDDLVSTPERPAW